MRKLRDKKSNLEKLPPSHCDDAVTERDENVTLETETETDTEIEQNPLLEKWLNEYSSGKNNPPAYKADMRKKILNKNQDAIQAFLEWEKEYLEKLAMDEKTQKIKSFDYNTMVGAKIDGHIILRVSYLENSDYIDIYVEDGEDLLAVPKEKVYEWINKSKKETA